MRANSEGHASAGRFLPPFGLAAIFVIALVVFGKPLYESNDDPALAMLGGGFGLVNQPDYRLIFSHVGYGLILNFLALLVGPNAHGVVTLLALALSFALFTRALSVCYAERPLVSVSIGIAAYGLVFTSALLRPQFTITSTLLVTGAIVSYLSTSDRDSYGRFLACVGLALGFLIRPEAGLAVIVVAAPALLWLAFRGSQPLRRTTIRLLVTLTVIAGCAYGSDWLAYHFSPDWKTALRYNQLRSLFIDFGRVPWVANSPAYARVGWSENDYVLFRDWFAADPIYSFSNISFLVEAHGSQSDRIMTTNVFEWLLPFVKVPRLSFLAVALVLAAAAASRPWTVLLFALGGLLCLTIVGLSGRFPVFRVSFSVASSALLCSMTFLRSEGRKTPWIAVAMGLIGLVAGGSVILKHREINATAERYREGLRPIGKLLTQKTIVWGGSLDWEQLITPTAIHMPLADHVFVATGVYSTTPALAATWKSMGIQDLGRTICTDPDVRIVANDGVIHAVGIYCKEHYNTQPDFKPVFTYPARLYAPAQSVIKQSNTY